MSDYVYLLGKPKSEARFKAAPEDFQVEEVLGFEPEYHAGGQHHWLYLEKTGMNTDFLARKLAEFAGVHPRDVSFSGLKDRQAITRQWFSVELPAKQVIDWQQFAEPGVRLLQETRSIRKLRRGTHQANIFDIRLRDLQKLDDIEERLRALSLGVPNYFGPQRFGHEGRNIEKAKAMLEGRRVKDRNLRSLLLSAARSWLFNQVVDARLKAYGIKPLAGDLMQLQGSHSFFVATAIDQTVMERLSSGDITITAPLPGKKKLTRDEPEQLSERHEFEAKVLEPYASWIDGLVRAGVEESRRAILLVPQAFEFEWLGQDLRLRFRLERGAFATSVLRELVQLKESMSENSTEQ